MAAAQPIGVVIRRVADVTGSRQPAPILEIAQASVAHQARFASYLDALRKAADIAVEWWESLIFNEAMRVGDRADAQINVDQRRPSGPACHAKVIHEVRSAWLDCEKINRDLPATLRVAPQTFVLLWLRDAGERELVDLLCRLHFWPIGLDDSGYWV